MIDKQTILDEIQRFARIGDEEPADIFISDVKELSGVGETRGARIVSRLVKEGILVRREKVMRAVTHRPAMAHRLAPGKTLDDLRNVLKKILQLDEERNWREGNDGKASGI